MKTEATQLKTFPKDRRERVLALIEQALRLIDLEGRSEEIGPNRVKMFTNDDFTIIHRTPEHPIPVSDELVAAGFTPEEQRRMRRDYGIEMWASGQSKVLNVIWNQGEAPRIIAFKRGRWEYEFLGLDGHRAVSPRAIH
jgi:hypothetical protein